MIKDFDSAFMDYGSARDYPAAAPEEPSLDGVQLAMGGGGGKGSNLTMTDAGMALLDTGAGVVRGAVAQTLGLPGDLQMLYNGLKSVFNRPEDQGRLDAFIQGVKQQTTFPTTDRVSEMLPPVVPAGAPDAKMRGHNAKIGQAFGEIAPLPGAIEAGVAGGKALVKSTKGMPVGLSIKPVGDLPTGAPTAPTSDIGFYSAVEQAALRIQRKQGTGQAMLNDILKGENVKQDEVKWIGLDDFLKGKKSVTREEVQQYIAENKVDVQEVTLGGKEQFDEQRLAQLESEYKALKQHPIDDPSFGEEKYDEMIRLMNIRDQSTTDGLYRLHDAAIRAAQRAQAQGMDKTAERYFREAELYNTRAEKLDLEGQGMSSPPKYDRYTLPGGENYREILLTMPTQFERMSKPLESEIRALGLNQNLNDISLRDLMNAGASADLQNRFEQAMRGSAEGSYHSNHWDEPNVLAHIRVNDRVDADGKKMLLVEEVQSDWHQEGRNKGYRTKESLEDWYNKNKLENDPPFAQLDSQQVSTIERNRNAGMGGDTAVPDAPMKDTWYQLALKRVLKYAADNGYERVGLTTGKTNADRYDLSKQVDEIVVPMVNEDGTRSVRIEPTTGSDIKLMVAADGTVTGYNPASRQFDGKRLDEVVGKEMADKILSAEAKTTFSGLDLQVGGEGMRKYYDEIYPQFLAKYGKKWDAKVGETTVKAGGAETVRYIDITPQMRESVSKGQPLFTATGIGTGTGAATMQDKEQK